MGKSKTSKHNREKRQKVHALMEEEMLHEMENQKVLQVTEFVTANELATMMNVPVTKIIATFHSNCEAGITHHWNIVEPISANHQTLSIYSQSI